MEELKKFAEALTCAFEYVEEMSLGYLEDKKLLTLIRKSKPIKFWEGGIPLDPEDEPLGTITVRFASLEQWTIEFHWRGNKFHSFTNKITKYTIDHLLEEVDQLGDEEVYYVDQTWVRELHKSDRLAGSMATQFGVACNKAYKIERLFID